MVGLLGWFVRLVAARVVLLALSGDRRDAAELTVETGAEEFVAESQRAEQAIADEERRRERAEAVAERRRIRSEVEARERLQRTLLRGAVAVAIVGLTLAAIAGFFFVRANRESDSGDCRGSACNRRGPACNGARTGVRVREVECLRCTRCSRSLP